MPSCVHRINHQFKTKKIGQYEFVFVINLWLLYMFVVSSFVVVIVTAAATFISKTKQLKNKHKGEIYPQQKV